MFMLLKVIIFYSLVLDLVNDSNSAKKHFSKLFK